MVSRFIYIRDKNGIEYFFFHLRNEMSILVPRIGIQLEYNSSLFYRRFGRPSAPLNPGSIVVNGAEYQFRRRLRGKSTIRNVFTGKIRAARSLQRIVRKSRRPFRIPRCGRSDRWEFSALKSNANVG